MQRQNIKNLSFIGNAKGLTLQRERRQNIRDLYEYQMPDKKIGMSIIPANIKQPIQIGNLDEPMIKYALSNEMLLQDGQTGGIKQPYNEVTTPLQANELELPANPENMPSSQTTQTNSNAELIRKIDSLEQETIKKLEKNQSFTNGVMIGGGILLVVLAIAAIIYLTLKD